MEIPILSELTLPAPWFGGGLDPYGAMGGLKFFAQDTLDTSYNLGLLWEPYRWVSFGAVYESQADAKMTGPYTFSYSQRMQNTINWLGSSPLLIIVSSILGLPQSCPAESSGNMSIDVTFPEHVQFGIKLQPHRRIKFLVDANWTQWSAWKSMDIVFDRPMPLLQMARLMGYTGGNYHLIMENHFKDTWWLGYGLELQPLDNLTLRFGYEYRPTSVTGEYFGPLPMGDLRLYSVGLGLDQKAPDRKFKGLHSLIEQILAPNHIDLSFTYMTSDYTVNFNQSKLFNSTNFTDIIYNPFAGLTYSEKTTSYIVSLRQVFNF
jgi:long-subunit fatty acid transport protein